jgi:hypothetical protein
MAEALESPLLAAAGFRHAFFTRRGGVSDGPYATLSFSESVGDRRENVAENLARAAARLGVEPRHVHFLSQVHGREVWQLDGSEPREATLQREGDALVCAVAGIACGVRVADCVPVLIGDRSSGAVAAAHAGWRGVVRGVTSAAVERLRALGSRPADLVAAIGPHLSLEAFEVSDDVAAELLRASPDPQVVDRTLGPKPHVDLARILRAQLAALGLAPAQIDEVPGCTLREPERFFSFRRDGARSGRHLAAIVARER